MTIISLLLQQDRVTMVIIHKPVHDTLNAHTKREGFLEENTMEIHPHKGTKKF